MAPDPLKELKARARAVDRALAKAYPEAVCELNFQDPLQCLVSTMLSAQTTDRAVNAATPALFAAFPDVDAFARAEPEDLAPHVKRLGLWRAKAKNIVAAARLLRDNFAGRVPDTMDELLTLPGVGRKTANCVLLNAYGKPGLMCDTHFCRLTRRIGFHELDDPTKIEFAMAALLPPEKWGDFSHRLILHGRRRCAARKPDCADCELRKHCETGKPKHGQIS